MSALAARRVPFAALLAVVGVAIALIATGGDDGYRLRVQVNDAAGLRKDFLVKIAGAPVGKVVDVELDRDDHAVAELQLDASAAPIGRDASAAIRASNLLGEKYVDIVPGDLKLPAPSGFLIPRARTTTPSDLDDVLSILDADTRLALGAFLIGQGEALVGRGGDLADTLVQMPPTLDAARELVSGLAQNNRALGSLVDRSDRVLATLAPRRRSLGRLVSSAHGAFGSLDSRRAALGETVRRAPGTLRQLRSSLDELDRAAAPLGSAARGLQKTAVPLEATLHALPPFTAAARPALRTARSVSPALGRLGREAEPVVRRLGPVGSGLRRFATALAPVTTLLDDGVADTLGVLQGWARSIQNRDGAGHVFRVSVELGGDILNALNAYIEAPATKKRRRPAAPSAGLAPAATKESGPGAARPQLKLPKVTVPKLALPKVDLPALPNGSKVDEAATALLDYLLSP